MCGFEIGEGTKDEVSTDFESFGDAGNGQLPALSVTGDEAEDAYVAGVDCAAKYEIMERGVVVSGHRATDDHTTEVFGLRFGHHVLLSADASATCQVRVLSCVVTLAMCRDARDVS
ncbi:MAG: hypothetical protein DIU79_02420 [Actinobacteria bacterium]|nr:MAG: hypothetical protein DIU79_02420 [Actinomycetota bacterium]